jgi:hypothetical protein
VVVPPEVEEGWLVVTEGVEALNKLNKSAKVKEIAVDALDVFKTVPEASVIFPEASDVVDVTKDS